MAKRATGTKVVHFSRETSFDSIGTDGFVTTTGVAITPVRNDAGITSILLNPVGENGQTVGNCRVTLDIDAMADIVPVLVRLMSEEMARVRAAGAPVPVTPISDRDPVEMPRPLTVEKLERRFGPSGEAPEYPRSDWMYEAGNGNTGRGYWDWVLARVELDTFERIMDLDHAAEKLLVERAAAAAEKLDTYQWKALGGIADAGSWVTVEFENHHELRTCVDLQDGGHIAFYVEFPPDGSKAIGLGTYPFDPARESLD